MAKRSFSELMDLSTEELIASVNEIPLRFRKLLATYYPDAHVRRACLRSIGVVLG